MVDMCRSVLSGGSQTANSEGGECRATQFVPVGEVEQSYSTSSSSIQRHAGGYEYEQMGSRYVRLLLPRLQEPRELEPILEQIEIRDESSGTGGRLVVRIDLHDDRGQLVRGDGGFESG
jgi:hypothetical protein